MAQILFQELFGIPHRVEMRINVTNACNLHCDYCDHDAHLPFSKTSSKVFRKKPLVVKPAAVARFCEAMVGVGEGNRHVLQGGEITVLPTATVQRYIDILHDYGRCVGMRTNGYDLTSLPLESINKLSFIYLNAHGNNRAAMDHCRRFLEDHYAGDIIDEHNYEHRDLAAYLHHGEGTVEEGLSCSHLLRTLTLIPPVVHPCCNSWALMNALNEQEMYNLLIEAGWTSENPDLKDTLRNWRETLPRPFLQTFCADSCYLTAKREASPLYRIQTHHLDKVLKV